MTLDPRLRHLLGFPLDELHRIKRQDDDAYREQVRAIDVMRERARDAQGERLQQLRAQISAQVAKLPVMSTFGVYFPEDDPKDVARVTHLSVPFASVTISTEASAEDLAALGIHVRSQSGNIFTAYLPLESARRLESSPAIAYVELARPWRPQLDTSIPQTQIDTLHAGIPAVTGNGVIVGIIDTGPLDFYHPAFRRTDDGFGESGLGSSRILYIWDQTLAPDPAKGESGPPEATYGTQYGKADIDTDLGNFPPAYGTIRSSPSGDFHGTLVTSCAAGNLRAPNYRYTGAAPEADIIYVRTTNGNKYVFADSTNILDGFAYIFARASEVAKPCVVNLSASDSLSAHDGSTHGEQFLDALLLEPGRVITCSAGNFNGFGSHTSGRVDQGMTTPVGLVYKSLPLPARWDDTVQFWYDGQDRLAVTITIPTPVPTVIGPVAAGASASATLSGGITVVVDSLLNDPRNDDNLIEVRIRGVNAANPIPAGTWTFALDGVTVINGAFDAWVDGNNLRFAAVSWDTPTEDENTIGAPATARRPITVGAHDAAVAPTILRLSGCGPTRDGRIKPEIVAPGFQMNGAAPRDMNAANPGPLEFPPIGPGLDGTSYSAPIVAGAAALLFECRGNGLTCADIKQILQDTAGTTAAPVPSNSFGFGFLQMANGCNVAAPDIDVWLRDSQTDTGVEPYTGGLGWLSPDIEVLDAAGNPTANPTHDPFNLWNNLIDVTVRNRGTQTARNIDVYLYWADPATNIPFPTEWRISGFYTGQSNFLQQSNRVVVPQLAAGASTTIRFAWAPPAPGDNIRGDDHFCLIARLEHEADPSNLNAGGFPIIDGSNNLALHNTHVRAVAAEVTTAVFVNGSGDIDRLELVSDNLSGDIEVRLPTRALPWHEIALLERCQGRRSRYGALFGHDPAEEVHRVLEAQEAARILGVTGAQRVEVDGPTTRVVAPLRSAPLVFSEFRLVQGAKMPLRVWARNLELQEEVGWVHIGQRSAGKLVGGISLEIRRQLPQLRKYDVRRRGDKVTVTPRQESADHMRA